MSKARVRELLVTTLSEMHDSEEAILRLLPLMSARAAAPRLRDLLDKHYRETQRHVARLAAAFDLLEERRRVTSALAMRGLIEEARARETFLERGELLDLALIDAARRIEHYEMAAYGAANAYARRMEHGELVSLLTETLEEERQADTLLELLTVPARVNAA